VNTGPKKPRGFSQAAGLKLGATLGEGAFSCAYGGTVIRRRSAAMLLGKDKARRIAANIAKLASLYYEEEPGRRSAAKLLTDEAQRIAANIAKLPELLQK
jgi:hypothetical protein